MRAQILDALPQKRTTRGRPDRPGPYYQTTGRFELDVDIPVPKPWHSVFAVILPPKGVLHEHTHPDDHSVQRWVVVAQTNPGCVSVNGGVESHLSDLGVYELAPGLPHSATNEGETERVHVIVETLCR